MPWASAAYGLHPASNLFGDPVGIPADGLFIRDFTHIRATISGVKKNRFTVKPRQEGQSLFTVIAEECGISGKRVQAAMDAKRVLVNGKRVWMRRHEMKGSDTVEILPLDPATSTAENIPAIWQDEHYLIVNKPPGLLTNAAVGSVEERLREQERNPEICAVHRLDKETSGCLLYAKSTADKSAAIPLFRRRRIIKVYRALTIGRFPPVNKIRTCIDGGMAATLVKTLDSNKNASYLELRIETGRTHQIRRHLAAQRHPVLGDKKYAGTSNAISLRQPRQMLHAYRLVFPHPRTGKPVRATAPFPTDFRRTLSQLKLH